MRNYQYRRPDTLAEALSLMERFGAQAKPLLGGTDLMVRILKGHAEPEAVVDLKRVRDIGSGIEIEGTETKFPRRHRGLGPSLRDIPLLAPAPGPTQAAEIWSAVA